MYHIGILLTALLAGQYNYITLQDSLVVVSWTLIAISALFYWLNFSTIVGLTSTTANPDIDVSQSLMIKVVQYVSAYFLYLNAEIAVAFFVLPYLLITTFTDGFAMLLKYEIIDVVEAEPEEDEEQ